MKALTAGMMTALMSCGGGWVTGGEPPREIEATPAMSVKNFVPGPPLWRPPAARPRPTSKSTSLEDVVDLCVTDEMAAVDTPGASVAVIVDGQLVYEQGYGVKQRGGTDPVDSDTQFRVGSVTKMFTAAAVMQQVDAGTVFLDDRLTRHVPEIDFIGHWPDDTITVEQLLTHATGIPDLTFNPAGLTGPNALSDWIDTLDWVGLHAPPGIFYNYSNPNFNLAGLVVERSTGTEYRTYMDANVFGPAGLSDTTFDPSVVAARGNATNGHMSDGQGGEIVFAPDEYDNGAYAPAGYAYSTAADLVRWALLLADGGGEVLSPTSAAAMQSIQQSMDVAPGIGYGYGIFVEPFYDLTVRQHGGNIWGWGAFLLWHPERRFAVAVLANTFQSLPNAAYCVAAEVLEPDLSVVIDTPPPDPARWQRLFEGMYDASITTPWASSSPYPVMGELSGFSDEQMLLHMWDPAGHWTALWFVDHQIRDVFLVDVDMDGSADLDLTFITSPGPPEQLKWLRMRPLVGYRQTPPRVGRQVPP
jgi:CubicO group peptidase (beta-lactamase class C family)